MIEYKGFLISDIRLERSHWSADEVEITIVAENILLKNNYIKYVPERHDIILHTRGLLEEKMEILREDIADILEKINENS